MGRVERNRWPWAPRRIDNDHVGKAAVPRDRKSRISYDASHREAGTIPESSISRFQAAQMI